MEVVVRVNLYFSKSRECCGELVTQPQTLLQDLFLSSPGAAIEALPSAVSSPAPSGTI